LRLIIFFLTAAQRGGGLASGSEARVGGAAGEIGQFFPRLGHSVFVEHPDGATVRQFVQPRFDLQSLKVVGEGLGRVGVRQYGKLSHQAFLAGRVRVWRRTDPFMLRPNALQSKGVKVERVI
jgi:hypothetical protein